MIEKVKKLIRYEPETEEEEFEALIRKPPKSTVWVTKPRQKWYVAYNELGMRMTSDDTFSSELGVFGYPIGLTHMSTPKYFIPSDIMIQLFSSMDWLGGDLRPEKKYRALKRPGVVEVLY